jgi:hypothetical protein
MNGLHALDARAGVGVERAGVHVEELQWVVA